MNKMFPVLVCALAAVSAFGAMDDARLSFETKGPDRYQDNTVVVDGEFYALVWAAAGSSFKGFVADGSLVDAAANRVVAYAPFAKDGHLPFVKLQLTTTEMAGYAGGSFELLLLDTRKADGSLAAARVGENGLKSPAVIHGYQSVASVSVAAATLASALDVASPIRIATDSVVPEGTPKPQIVSTFLRSGKNGQEFVIRVKGTSAYLRYAATAVAADGSAKGQTAANAAVADGAGDPEQEIELVYPASGSSGLFKVTGK